MIQVVQDLSDSFWHCWNCPLAKSHLRSEPHKLRQISVRNVTKIYIWPHLLLLWKSITTKKPVLHGAEVELNLFLDAQLRPAWFWPSRSTWWTSWPHRAPQYNIERATSDNGVPGDVNGQEGGHLVARVKQVLVLVLVLEPLAGHCVIRDNTGLYWKIPSQSSVY